MAVFKVSKTAESDLFDIGKYTERKWGKDQRNKYLDEIGEHFHLLADNPDYPNSKDRSEVKKDCFSLTINEHVIIYRKFSYGVRVVRVLHQSMDIKRHL